MAPKTVLVTGTQGFVGSRLARRLLSEGFAVRGLVRREGDVPGVELVRGDITDIEVVRQAVEGVDVVVHCVANFGAELQEAERVNVAGTRTVAEAALLAGCERFVHLSTCGVYNLVGLDLVEESTLLWDFDEASELVYGVTKAEGERVVNALIERGLKGVILRPPNLLGADLLNSWSYHLALHMKEGKLEVGGDGSNTWPYTYIENLLDAILLAIRHPRAVGNTYTVVDGHTTWGEYTSIFAGWLGTTLPRRAPKEPYDSFRGKFSTEKVRKELGYLPRVTFDEAMSETERFLKEQQII